MAELKLKKCLVCGRIVEVTDNESVMCCGQEMVDVVPNSTDAAVEKHVPEYTIEGDEIVARVNHVMEEDHYIEWISASYEDGEHVKYLNPNEEPVAEFKYVPGMVLYSYCNKHLLWKTEVK